MYTANDIRKIQVSLGLVEESEVGADLSKRYTAEDIAAIQKRNAQIGREQLRLEGRAPSATQAISGGRSAYDLALEQYREDRISDPMEELARRNGEKEPHVPQEGLGFASDAFDRWLTETFQKMDKNYNTVAQWYGEAGTEQNERRHALMRDLKNAYADVARKVESGELEKTGTIWAMANQQAAEKGYSRGEISIAHQIMNLEDEMGIYDEGRRVGQTMRGVVAGVASAIPQVVETVKQGMDNTAARQALSREDEDRALSVAVDTVMNLDRAPEVMQQRWQSQGIYNLDDLIQKNKNGWTEEEILSMVAALNEAAAPVSQDSLGYKIYQAGQAALEDAMRGESEGQRFLHSAATSAGENLALAAINPGLVLPVLTAQSVADSLGEATASGKAPSRALTSAGLKAGVGWIIEEAGVAQMAQNMGKQFAASALSQNILNFINSAPGMGALKESAPVLYGVVASGADEAVEEFVQSYANKLVDVAMGDAAADELLSLEQLAEASMGAAGGALGGAMIGGASSAIGAMGRARQAWQSPRPEQVADQQLSAAIQQAGQSGAAQQMAQSAEQVEAVPAAEPAPEVQEPQAELDQEKQTLLNAYLQSSGGRLEGSIWEALREQPGEDSGAQIETLETPAAPAQTEAEHQDRMAERQGWNEDQQEQAWLLENETSMSEAAVNVAVEAMPEEVSREAYLVSANSLYQMARQGVAKTVDEAIRLAEQGGARVGDVLATPGGESALRQIYNQGRIEGIEASDYGRAGLAPEETAGTVKIEEGAVIPEEDEVLLDLAAAASDTAVTVRERLENNASGYVDTALGQIYFAAEEGQDTFGTVLHEQTHLYNALDPEGGRVLQNNVLKTLAESRGYEQVDSLIQSYIRRYQEAGSSITYAQACEEVAADAWRGVFGSVESFARWAQRQAAQAEKNAESRGAIRKMMDTVKGILDNIIQRAKQILAREPENTAARWAMELAEDQKRALEEEYYRHQDAALEAQRTARRDVRAVENQAISESRTENESLSRSAANEAGKRSYQLPVEDGTREESGQKAAAWEHVDRGELERAMTEAYQEKNIRRVPVENIRKMAQRLLREEGSKANQITIAKKLENFMNWLAQGGDFDTAIEVAGDIAETVMQGSNRKDTTLYDQYPDLHRQTLYVKRGGTEYKDIVAKYGSYAEGQKELRRVGVDLTTSEAKSDFAIDKVYKTLTSEYGEMFPAEVYTPSDQLDVIADKMAMIRPTVVNDYGENYDEYKADLSMRILGMAVAEGVTDQSAAGMLRQRIDENLNRHRVGIRERVVNNLGRIEREAKQNKRKAEALARMNRNQRVALASSMDQTRRVRDARTKDSILRSMASDRAKLNRMLLHPSEKSHVPAQYLQKAIEIADLANQAVNNKDALTRLKALKDDIKSAAMQDDGVDSMAADFESSGIEAMLDRLTTSIDAELMRSRKAEAAVYQAERRADQSGKQLTGIEGERAALAQQAEEGGLRQSRMTVGQLTTLHDLLRAMVTLAQNSNKLMAAKTNLAASEFALNAVENVGKSKYRLGIAPGVGKLAFGAYQANVLNATRMIKRMGGYIHGGAMEVLADALKNGEAKMINLREKGAQIFRQEVENREALKKFAGRGATLYDNILFDENGNSVPVNMAQIVSIWKHLQHPQNREHLMKGGLVVPDMKLYAKGKIEEAYRNGKTAHLDFSTDVVARIEGMMDDYARQWSADLDQLLNHYTKDLINTTSRRLSGYDKAKVEAYYPITVDPNVLSKEIEGLVYNGTIENRGFLKERVNNSPQPILLEECTSVAMRTLSDAAAYAGLAPAIRDANKVWNANRSEAGSLKAAVSKSFGTLGVKSFEQYIEDLQKQPRGRQSLIDFLSGYRGRYAGAVLTYNVSAILGQISGVAAAGSELGGKATLDAYRSFFTDMGKEKRGAILQEMRDHDFYLVESTMSAGTSAELNALKKQNGRLAEILESLPGANLLEKMDVATRAAIWEGAKSYVNSHLSEFGLKAEEGRSEAWWNAVSGKAAQTLENTQPNYTISQRAAIQRNPDHLLKTLTMFKTPAFQNYGILSYAAEDYLAQREYLKQAEKRLAEGDLDQVEKESLKQEQKRYTEEKKAAATRLSMAVGSQIAQTALYVLAQMLAKDWLLHRPEEEKDEDGNFTLKSVGGRFLGLSAESIAGNAFLLPEVINAVRNLTGEGDENPVNLTGLDAISELMGDARRLVKEADNFRNAEEGEKDLAALIGRIADVSASLGNLTGVPVGQIQRIWNGVHGWAKDIATAAANEGLTVGDILTAPESSSSQYDDLYTAVFENGDPADAQDAIEALQKLDLINPPKKPSDAKAGDTKIISELLKREKEFGTLIQDAAAARVAGNSTQQQKLMQQLVNTLADALDINPKTKDGQRRLTTVINKVNTAISDEVRAQMGADSSTGATIYTPVLNALKTGSGLEEALAVLRRAGIQDSDIRSAVQTAYKEDYLYSDNAGRAAIERKLLTLKDADGEPYFTEGQLADWVTDWELKGFNESVYTDLDEALQTRNRLTAQEEIYRYMNAGKDSGSIRDRIVALYRDAYLAASQAERQEIAKFLVGLRGPKGEKFITTDTLIGWIKSAALGE